MLLTITKHQVNRFKLRWFPALSSIPTSIAMSTVNGRVLFVEPPITYIEPGKHIRYSEEKIDLPGVGLSGGVLVKTLILSPDPYMRGKLGRNAWPVGSPCVDIKNGGTFEIGLIYIALQAQWLWNWGRGSIGCLEL